MKEHCLVMQDHLNIERVKTPGVQWGEHCGQRHQRTGFDSLIFTKSLLCSQVQRVSFFEGTDVEFANLSEEVIRGYVATGEPMDKAGGYGIQVCRGKKCSSHFDLFQACGCTLVKGIHGDYFNVMGFPAHRLTMICLLCKQSNSCLTLS